MYGAQVCHFYHDEWSFGLTRLATDPARSGFRDQCLVARAESHPGDRRTLEVTVSRLRVGSQARHWPCEHAAAASEPVHLPRHRRALDERGAFLRVVARRPKDRWVGLGDLGDRDRVDAPSARWWLQPSQQRGKRPACSGRRAGVGKRSHQDHLCSGRAARCRSTVFCRCATAFQVPVTLGVGSRRIADTTPGLSALTSAT